MKLIVIPPYRREGVNYDPKEGHFFVRELLAIMKEKGQLAGVEVDIDEAHPTDHSTENRDEEVLANISVGFIKRVRKICELGKYDAIVSQASIEPGLFGARMISNIPIAYATHSAVHLASLIGDRFTILTATDVQALIIRHFVQLYGLSHKLASVRYVSRSSTQHIGLIRKYKREERSKVPEVKKLVNDIVAEYITAIEKDRADSLILGSPYQSCFLDDIRQGLNESGYGEIQLIGAFSAAVEMAKAMVNMKLIHAPRAYPSDALKSKPEFR